MNNMCALINIFLIALMVQVGMAIKCFTCDSSVDEKCANMTIKGITAEECTPETVSQQEKNNVPDDKKHWVFKMSHFNAFQVRKDAEMACQKIVGIDENKNETIVRRCQFNQSDLCDATKSQVKTPREITHCSLCDKDGCNGSSNNQVFGMMIGVVTTITVSLHLIL